MKILCLVLISSVMFGAASSSGTSGEQEMAAPQQCGPFTISGYRSDLYYVCKDWLPGLPGVDPIGESAVAIAQKGALVTSASVQQLLLSFVTELKLRLYDVSSIGQSYEVARVLNRTNDAQTVKVAGKELIPKIALLYHLFSVHDDTLSDSMVFTVSSEWQKGQCMAAPFLGNVVDHGDIEEYTLSLPDSIDDDGSPVVTWKKPSQKEKK